MIDNELVKEIQKRADIVKVISQYITLTKKGRNFLGKCPFHNDNNPSFTVSPEKQIFSCWVCGKTGSVFRFVQDYEQISFPEAVKKVADFIGFHDARLESNKKVIEPKDDKNAPLYKCLQDICVYYQYAVNTDEGKDGLDYFNKRNLDSDIRNKFLLGYAFKDGAKTCEFLKSKGHSLKTIEDVGISGLRNGEYYDKNEGRVIFPICNKDGQVVGFSARRLNEDKDVAKYINSPETAVFHKSNILYNFHTAKSKCLIDKYIYICEGFMDVIALAKAGIYSAVATMGTALTEEHIKLLKSTKCEIRLCLDTDVPGQTATMRAAKMLKEAEVPFRIVNVQGMKKDPDEILNEQGKDVLLNYLNNLLTFNDFIISFYTNTVRLSTTEQKKALVKEMIPFLLSINSQLEFDDYTRKIAHITGFEIDSIKEVVKNMRYAKTDKDVKKAIYSFHPERKTLQRLQTAEREILFQMLHSKLAVSFYEENISGFYDNNYRLIANYILDQERNEDELNVAELITTLETSTVDNKDELIYEISTLVAETDSHPKECTIELLTNLFTTINDEKKKIFEKDLLDQLFVGKNELEKARILAEYNRKKMKN